MQCLGYFYIGDEKYKVLMYQSKYHRCFKKRVSGKDGTFFEDENNYINEMNDRMELKNKLDKGEVIKL
jgi:hypothetical protein